ncbi:adhesion G-protein coupled receptor F3 [Thalassophryne amazonica]|uniref:adhesion G-protein coupled receptor F3 n=1 Tax=Thalassophryne amazonica TaxID=390379 RepID=UPI0014714144|nr:adhesion G-protein coupled receptor F3 [Thalassophryne amazonica]
MVSIDSPNTTVCYNSIVTLKCAFKEPSDHIAWYMYKDSTRSVLCDGTVVTLQTCPTETYKSCLQVKLNKVTGRWASTYECGFSSGSVTHTARTLLSVSLLPDKIDMIANPLTVNCAGKPQSSEQVMVNTIIQNSTELYEVHFYYQGTLQTPISPKPTDDEFCRSEVANDVLWPDTPAGDTVIIRKCEAGRVGYKSRTCDGTTWQPVSSHCVTEFLNTVVSAAEDFKEGLNATPEIALYIFQGLQHVTEVNSGSGEGSADLSASIDVLRTMSSVSDGFQLSEEVLPMLVGASSNMLNDNWNKFNMSVKEDKSADYLQSVENLVKNIKVNMSRNITSQNIELKICTNLECHISLFNMDVNVTKMSGTVKSFAAKNLTDKLKNNVHDTVPTDLLISTTLLHANNTYMEIKMDFPLSQQHMSKHFCVFWNTTERIWSSEGCRFLTSHDNKTICICTHLTSFSVLMSKSEIDLPFLEEITYVGLGVSICCLVLFLTVEHLVWSAVVKSNLSHFRHTALVNIAVCLLLAHCCFLASSAPDSLSDSLCLSLTICKHFFFLAMFGWMFTLSIMLVHQLIFVFNPLRKRVFMFFSSILGYVCPFIIVGVSYMYYNYTYTSYHDPASCWLNYKRLMEGSLHAFLLPVGTVVLANLFSMVVVMFTLLKSSVPDASKANDKETAKSILKVVVFLTPVFGVTWIFGFFQLIFDTTPMHPFFAYCFTILNAFQGLFIFLTGCFAEQKVRGELLKLIAQKNDVKQVTSTKCEKDK